jgi:hypothetical protein
MVEDIVDVTTNIVIMEIDTVKNFQVVLNVVPTEGTNKNFLGQYPNGFERLYDHKTIGEAYQTLLDINERMGLPKPPIPSAAEATNFNDQNGDKR